jgi:hypothetical protein
VRTPCHAESRKPPGASGGIPPRGSGSEQHIGDTVTGATLEPVRRTCCPGAAIESARAFGILTPARTVEGTDVDFSLRSGGWWFSVRCRATTQE